MNLNSIYKNLIEVRAVLDEVKSIVENSCIPFELSHALLYSLGMSFGILDCVISQLCPKPYVHMPTNTFIECDDTLHIQGDTTHE